MQFENNIKFASKESCEELKDICDYFKIEMKQPGGQFTFSKTAKRNHYHSKKFF